MSVELCCFDLHYLCFPKVPSPCLIVPPFLVPLWHTAILLLLRRPLLYQCEVLTLLLLCSDFNFLSEHCG